MGCVRLVYDGNVLLAPREMGTARVDQLVGTPAEQLSELAGRVCYDSLGQGRGSLGFHAHIQEVKHYNVYEHFNFTVEILIESQLEFMAYCACRPGVYAAPSVSSDGLPCVRVTLNLRSVLEWDLWTPGWQRHDHRAACIGAALQLVARPLAPQVVPEYDGDSVPLVGWVVAPESDEEKWMTLYLEGSRGFSHEMVRHRYRTAVSQRSTRYCDESEAPWHHHPLTKELTPSVQSCVEESVKISRVTYGMVVTDIQHALAAQGADKLTARKQARGAARGYLGNALGTAMLFSASVAQWNRIFEQRCSPYADAEIREIMEAARGLIG